MTRLSGGDAAAQDTSSDLDDVHYGMGAEGDGEAAKERVMKMLAVMFDPSDIDYYYED